MFNVYVEVPPVLARLQRAKLQINKETTKKKNFFLYFPSQINFVMSFSAIGQSGHGHFGHFRFRERGHLLTIYKNNYFYYSGGFDIVCFRF